MNRQANYSVPLGYQTIGTPAVTNPLLNTYYTEPFYYIVQPTPLITSPPRGLEAILVAILVLTALDLVLIRPMKFSRVFHEK